MATPPNSQADSSVDKFATGDTSDDDTKDGTQYSDPDSQGEPTIMLSSAQADAAGMAGAMPGDTFTVKVTITDQSDDGWNVELEPGSAVKDEAAPSMAPKPMGASMKPKGPMDLGMSPTVLNT